MQPKPRFDLPALVALALVARAMAALASDVVGTDAYAFILGAKEIAAADWHTSLANGIHPGYPLAIAIVAVMGVGRLAAGLAVSAVCGAAAVVPFFALVRDAAGRRAAIVASLLLATLPAFVREHGDIMTEGLFHLLFLSSLALAWFGTMRRSAAWLALAGAAGGAAYATRPEGIYLPVAITGLVAMALVEARRRREPVPWRLAAFGALAIAIFLAMASPLLVTWRHLEGAWSVTSRGSARLAASDAPMHLVPALGALLYELVKVSYGVLLALGIAGIALRRARPLATVFFLCIALGYCLAPALAASRGYPFSGRYVLVPLLFLLPFSAVAIVALVDATRRRWGAIALGLVAVAFLARSIPGRDRPEWTMKEAALWVGAQSTGPVYASNSKPACYLERRVTLIRPSNVATVPAGAFLIVNEADVGPELLRAIESRFRRVRRLPDDGRAGVPVSIFTN